MKFIHSHLLAMTISVPLAACGSVEPSSDGADAGSGADAAGEIEDTTAPTLLSTSPENGDVGQFSDVAVVFEFSEAMDQASVEDTLDTTDLGTVAMSWNAAGDTLTITPDEELAYAEGVGDPAVIDATEFRVILGNAAKDLAGNDLGTGISVGFSTLKSVGLVLDADSELSRVVTPSDFLFQTSDPFVVGDRIGDVTEEGMRSAMTFDISAIPSAAVGIDSAVLSTRQLLGDLQGTPFTDLGSAVLLDHVSYADAGGANSAFNSSQTALSTVGNFFVEDEVAVQADVSGSLGDDLANRAARGNRSQFLARFDTITNLDDGNDRAVFSRDLLELSVNYLIP